MIATHRRSFRIVWIDKPVGSVICLARGHPKGYRAPLASSLKSRCPCSHKNWVLLKPYNIDPKLEVLNSSKLVLTSKLYSSHRPSQASLRVRAMEPMAQWRCTPTRANLKTHANRTAQHPPPLPPKDMNGRV